ncbi:MAG: peroxidase, partial [Pseudonocardia sp.]
SVEEREHAVGRRMLDDVELDEATQPPVSHVALTQIVEEDGTEREILRDNMPFGSIARGEYGTYFIGYAADPDIPERMLRRMFVGEPVGSTDRLLEFSTAVTGTLFFVPSAAMLDDPPPARAAADPGEPAPARGDLGIGDLRSAR